MENKKSTEQKIARQNTVNAISDLLSLSVKVAQEAVK